jgi:hypothetical protein
MKRYEVLWVFCLFGLLYFKILEVIDNTEAILLSEYSQELNSQQSITCSTWQDYSAQFHKINKRLDSLEMWVSELNLPLQNCVNDFNTLNNMLWHK